ncbi:MAG: hypothetical protein WBG86_20045 [Polyangiales bacterium]
MFIQAYIFSLVLSAILLMASLLLADGAPDIETDRADGTLPASLKSMRFWTFVIAFFGMTGLLLDGLDVLRSSTAFMVALGVGLAVAVAVNAVVRANAP